MKINIAVADTKRYKFAAKFSFSTCITTSQLLSFLIARKQQQSNNIFKIYNVSNLLVNDRSQQPRSDKTMILT